jgi:hypothetical protein
MSENNDMNDMEEEYPPQGGNRVTFAPGEMSHSEPAVEEEQDVVNELHGEITSATIHNGGSRDVKSGILQN